MSSCLSCSRAALYVREARSVGSRQLCRILPTLHPQVLHSSQPHHRCAASKRQLILSAPTALLALQLGGMPAQAYFAFIETKPTADGMLLNANDFEVVVPANFVDLGVPKTKKATGAITAAPGAPPPPSPVKARYGTPDGTVVVSVIVKEASSIKPTFVQLQDISAWGNGTEVAQLLLPKSARIRSFDKVVIPLPPKDTRTVKGVVEVPPLTIYRYFFDAGGGKAPVRLAAAAQKGRLYLMAATAPDAADEATEAGLERALETFRCKDEFKPLY